jgi:hypothetical protein
MLDQVLRLIDTVALHPLGMRLIRAKRLQSCVLSAGGQLPLRDLRDRHGFQNTECIELVRLFPNLLRYKAIPAKGKGGGRRSEVLKAVRNRGVKNAI